MNDVETRTVLMPRTGTKICVLVGLAFIVLAIYFFVVPITSVRTTSGGVFGCGTALSPAHGSFADGVCWRIADANRYRAYAALAIGIITVIAGALMFGFDHREEERQVPRDHHEFADRADLRGDDHDRAGDSRDDDFGDRRSRRSHRATDDLPGRRRPHREDDDGFDGDDARLDRPARRSTPDEL